MTGKSQHEFTKGKSCLTNLIIFCDKITPSVNMGRAVEVAYLDFNKVLNSVSQSLLLNKLTRYRLDGWSARCVGNLLAGWIQGGDQWLLLRLAACHEWYPTGINTGPCDVQHLINDLGNGIENTLITFPDDRKLGDWVDMLRYLTERPG